MKKILKLMLVVLTSIMFVMGVKAYAYDNMNVEIVGVDTSIDNPYDNAKFKITEVEGNFSGFFLAITADPELLTDTLSSFIASDYSNKMYFDQFNDSNEADRMLTNYIKFAQTTNNVYVAVYKSENGTITKQCRSILVTRPEAPGLTHRSRFYALSGNDITLFVYDLINKNPDKTFNYKIGLIDDVALLKELKAGRGISNLLAYAKAQTGDKVKNTGTILYGQGKATNNLNPSDYKNKAYYYAYISLDTENGKYIPIEDIHLYQANINSTGNEISLINQQDSNFVWEDFDDTTTPSTPETVYIDGTFYCVPGDVVPVSVQSAVEITTYRSADETIATFEPNPGGTACGDKQNCFEYKINCLSLGNTSVTAKNSSGSSSTANVTVLESLDKVTITYDSNGGSKCSPETKEVFKGQKAGELCKPTRKNYLFDGWYINGLYKDNKKVNSDKIINEDITVKAIWIKNEKTGIATPILGMVILTCVSAITFILVTKKSRMFN